MTRWNRRLLIGALAILVPALAGCEAGFNAPTLEFHQASFGASTIVDGISIDNVFVLGPAPGSTLQAGGQASLFMALQSSNADQLTSISAPGAASSVQLGNGPITLSPNTLVDLSGPEPLLALDGLTNPLSGGETVTLVLHFATAGSVTLMVPVEPGRVRVRDLLAAAHPHRVGGAVRVLERAQAQGQEGQGSGAAGRVG